MSEQSQERLARLKQFKTWAVVFGFATVGGNLTIWRFFEGGPLYLFITGLLLGATIILWVLGNAVVKLATAVVDLISVYDKYRKETR